MEKIKDNSFVGYVTATCKNKKCQKAFMWYDKKGQYNDEPPSKYYCPECVQKGLKNPTQKRKTATKRKSNLVAKFLKENKITDKIVIREFKKLIKARNVKRGYKRVLKEAIEVAQYYK